MMEYLLGFLCGVVVTVIVAIVLFFLFLVHVFTPR